MPMARHESCDAEEPVVEAIRGGDRSAFAEFVRRHNGWVRGAIYGVLGERDRVDDVAQQVWTTVWQRIEELRDASRWRPWLYRLARNAAIDAGRDVSRRRDGMQRLRSESGELRGSSSPQPASARTPDRELAGREQHEEVLAAIQSLPALYREPFVLRHLNGWTYNRIAELMGMPVDSVETRLVRARRLLRECLRDVL